jgi:DNA polymerase II small subunit/DNA polymerase delta subunit B
MKAHTKKKREVGRENKKEKVRNEHKNEESNIIRKEKTWSETERKAREKNNQSGIERQKDIRKREKNKGRTQEFEAEMNERWQEYIRREETR